MDTINIDIYESLREIALRGIAARNKANKLYKQRILEIKNPHDPENDRKLKEEDKINESIKKYLLRREKINEQNRQKRLEANKKRGRPFTSPENQFKKEELLRQLNELKELKIKETIELSDLDKIEIQMQKLLKKKQDILNKNALNETNDNI